MNKVVTSPPLPSPLPPAPQPLPGDIHGYVGGPGGLPAIGATVVAAEQQTGYTINSIVSIDGQILLFLTTRKIYCDGGLS